MKAIYLVFIKAEIPVFIKVRIFTFMVIIK
jgi:hypothetical protein